MKKVYDMVVATGSYTNAQGETKKRYENIGAVMKGDNGPFLFLKKTFSPAGIETEPGRESILVSLFEPKQQQAQTPPQQKDDFDDEIPF